HIVVGGGQSGLVVARRLLSPTTRVLVIEAGPDWAAHPNDIIPGMAWYGGLAYPDSPYDWGYYTVPQPHLKNRQIYWPRGKLLGGSSAVNGLYLVRSSREEQEAWEALWDGVWDWEGVHEWMKKVCV
ncbi:GMC oxidoreductase, partial [Atractiella rhizophila]